MDKQSKKVFAQLIAIVIICVIIVLILDYFYSDDTDAEEEPEEIVEEEPEEIYEKQEGNETQQNVTVTLPIGKPTEWSNIWEFIYGKE